MEQVKLVHVEFVDNAVAACKALSALLDALDNGGAAGDAAIEQKHGAVVLQAYIVADTAYQNLEAMLLTEDD